MVVKSACDTGSKQMQLVNLSPRSLTYKHNLAGKRGNMQARHLQLQKVLKAKLSPSLYYLVFFSMQGEYTFL